MYRGYVYDKLDRSYVRMTKYYKTYEEAQKAAEKICNRYCKSSGEVNVLNLTKGVK